VPRRLNLEFETVKRAILSDIHGNLMALDAVLSDIRDQQVDQIYCLGDVVGYGPNPRECVDRMREADLCVLGNHDQAALFDPDGFSSGAERAIFWTRKQIEDAQDPKNPERWNFLCELPRVHRDGEFMFVHGSARSPLHEYVFPEDIYNAKKLERIFSLVQRYCFQGHTHAPGVFTEDFHFHRPDQIDFRYDLGPQKAMVNVGSVGQPRDGDNRACYVILDTEEKKILYRRIAYDIDTTAQRIYAIPELDNFLGDRLYEGR
jgi:predicted phosphodiesterase